MFTTSALRLCLCGHRAILSRATLPLNKIDYKGITSTAFLQVTRRRDRAAGRQRLQDNIKEMKKKGTFHNIKRSDVVEWNYPAELYAFGRRLNENFDQNLLKEALIDLSYVHEEEKKLKEVGMTDAVKLTSNRKLSETGEALIKNFSKKYLRAIWPLLPEEAIEHTVEYLTSTDVLRLVGRQLGLRDLISSADYPPNKETYSRCFSAVVAALNASSGIEVAQKFILDFVITRLEGIDLWDIWQLSDPMGVLHRLVEQSGMGGPPEPRLLGQIGQTTLESVYYIGIYVDKQLIGTGYGETTEIGINNAVLDSLSRLFERTADATPIPYLKQISPDLLRSSRNLYINEWDGH